MPSDSDPGEAMAAFAQANGHAVTVAELKQVATASQAAANDDRLSDTELSAVSGGVFGNGTFLIDPNGAVGGAIGNAASGAFGWSHKMMTGR